MTYAIAHLQLMRPYNCRQINKIDISNWEIYRYKPKNSFEDRNWYLLIIVSNDGIYHAVRTVRIQQSS